MCLTYYSLHVILCQYLQEILKYLLLTILDIIIFDDTYVYGNHRQGMIKCVIHRISAKYVNRNAYKKDSNNNRSLECNEVQMLEYNRICLFQEIMICLLLKHTKGTHRFNL